MLPLTPILITALSLSVTFGMVGLGVGINALEKRNDEIDFVKEHAPTGVTLNVEDHDAFDSGVNVTVISGVLGITSLLTLLYLTLRPLPRSTTSSSSRKPAVRPLLLLTSALHTLFSLWIFAALIAYDVIVRDRSARVSAFLPNGQPLPQSLVEQQERALGVSSVYWDKRYLRLLAILPWIAFLFGLTAAILLFRAASTLTAVPKRHGTDSGSNEADSEEDRGSVSKEGEVV